jgi:hypothetical protein
MYVVVRSSWILFNMLKNSNVLHSLKAGNGGNANGNNVVSQLRIFVFAV